MKFDDLASDAEKHELATADRSGVADLVNAWCRRRQFTWFDQEHEYSALFQEMYPERRSRQRYIESKVEGAFPSWGYLYLASIISKGYFNVAFTTNFDDLVNDALAIYLRMNPVVCAADSEVMSISITSDRPKIIKLHGDYLFERLKNTVEELEQLDPNMERKFREFAKDCGVVVLGYGGRDRSIMRVVEELLGDDEMFPLGVYWGVRRERDGTFRPASRVEELATRFALSYRMQLTNFYWFRQQPLLALPHLEAAVAIEPNSPEAHGWLGQVYLALGQLTPAQREMDIALRLSPQDVRLLVNTGILYLQLSQPDLAEGYLQQATQLNPTATQPHVLLCQLYWTSNRVGEFNTALQTLARIDASLARQVQMQLQAMQVQSMGQPYNQQAALQAQWRAWLQAQSQAAHGQPWSPTQAAARTPPPPSGTGAPGRDSGLPPRPW